MKRWLRLAYAAALVGCLAPPAHSAPARTTTASGLLLGLCNENGCRTLWITAPGGRWEITAQGEGILTPRRTGFWRVGVWRPAEGEDWFRWGLWAAPANGRRPTPPPAVPEEDEQDLRHYGGVRSIRLSFVGPNHVAANEHCETHGPHINYNQNSAVLSLDELGKAAVTDQLWSGLPIGTVLGPQAQRVFSFAARSARRDQSASQEERDTYPDEFLAGASSSWSLERSRGRWTVTGSSGYGSGAARGYYFRYVVPVHVPATVAGFDEERIPWELIVEEYPEAVDAYASPARDVVFVITPGRLLACPRGVDGRPGRPLAVLPIPGRPDAVMVQWAHGANVARWSRELTRLLQ